MSLCYIVLFVLLLTVAKAGWGIIPGLGERRPAGNGLFVEAWVALIAVTVLFGGLPLWGAVRRVRHLEILAPKGS